MNGNAAFTYMANLLVGRQYTPHQCLLIADEVVSTVGNINPGVQHLKLTERLYTPTVMENFANA